MIIVPAAVDFETLPITLAFTGAPRPTSERPGLTPLPPEHAPRAAASSMLVPTRHNDPTISAALMVGFLTGRT
jgi:hypothetical protein